jgi:ParB-like nuclease domain
MPAKSPNKMSKAKSAKSTKAKLAKPAAPAAPAPAKFAIEEWPIDKPIPYARNARKITQAAIDKVAASIQEFGWQQPIVVDKDRVILAGHTRHLAAQKLVLKTVPVHVASDLSITKAKAYRLSDNRTNDEASWDNELLALEFEDLKVDEFDLALTGFSFDEIGKLAKPPAAGDLLDPTGGSGTMPGEDSDWLRWGSKKVPLSDDELEALSEAHDKYTNEAGVSYGFVRSLLGLDA